MSGFGNDGIWTIIDRFSKQAHFIPVKKTIKANHMAHIFMTQIFKHHRLPKTIVSDRDPSLFWCGLFDNMGTKLKFLSAFHPQIDGQSEIANSIVLDILKCYVGERKIEWEKYLPFEVIYGKVFLPSLLRTKDEIFVANEYV